MPADTPTIEGLSHDARLQLLELLLNDLHHRGLLSQETLLQIASDVVLLDYHEDEDLICHNCGEHEIEEE